MAAIEGVLKLEELETTALDTGGLKEKDCGAGVSNAENLQKENTDFFLICIMQIKTLISQLKYPNK